MTLQEACQFIQYAGISRMQHIPAGHERQPEIVVGATGAYPSPCRGMPPMLHVSFPELTGGAEQKMFAYESRLRMKDSQGILQLIAESECSPRLVITAASPDPAGNGLVKQPPVRQYIQGGVRRCYLQGAQCLLPVSLNFLQGFCGDGIPLELTHQAAGLLGIFGGAQ